MNRRSRTRTRTRALLTAGLLACLPAAHATTPATALRIQLRVVEACSVDPASAAPPCPTAHQRSDTPTPPPPQVLALTPPMDGDETPARAWQTFTF